VRFADYRIDRASAADVDVILALRDEAAHWLVERGIDQWSPGEIPRSWIEHHVEDGLTFLLRRTDLETVGTVTVLWSDELIWGDNAGDAATCTC
jgi:hypothetical protein